MSVPILVAVIWAAGMIIKGASLAASSKFEGRLSRIQYSKPPLTQDQVTALLGRPARIEQSDTVDQSLNGEVDYYPTSNGTGRVVYINHTVFKAEFVPKDQKI